MARQFMDGYKTYDPFKEGFGHSGEWRKTFQARMSPGVAEEILRGTDNTPAQILGVSETATIADIRKAYLKKSMACHPDRCAIHGLSVEEATERFKELNAAYTLLT